MQSPGVQSILFAAKCGKEIVRTPYSFSDGRTFEARAVTFDCGYALYVSATSKDGFPAEEAISFALPIEDTGDFLAINNHSDYWCRPFWASSLSSLPIRTQELLVRTESGYVCYLPVVADTYKTLIRGKETGAEAYLYSNVDGLTEIRDQLSLVVMEGSDPLTLLRSIAEKAAFLLGNGLRMREERAYPEALEYLGWCSWDALHIFISHDGMLEKVREFKEKDVPVGFAIFDDMWADAPLLSYIPRDAEMRPMIRTMHASMLRSFEGDPVRFPYGMKAAVSAVKEAGIPYVGVWFPTTGYWSGLQPGGEIAEELRDVTAVTEEKRQIIASPEDEKAAEFFDVLCARTASWGADFVKIDNQGYHTRYKNLAPIGQSSRSIQNAIDGATAKHFGGALINCMGMPSECMLNRRESAISRCSDDFQPESRPWFAKNILQCSYNGLLQGQYYVNDWDMWWTDDEQAKKNSLCRAVSGGPIYVSDKLGRTRPEILAPLSLHSGRILRCDESATPTADCLLRNPTETDRIFKIRNRTGDSAVLAAFNINIENRPMSGTVSLEDARLEGNEYVLYEYFSRTATVLKKGDSLPVSLTDNDDFRLYTLVPKERGFTVLGRTDLYIGVKAIVSRDENRVTVLEGGEISLYSDFPVTVTAEGKTVDTVRVGNVTRFTLPTSVTSFTVSAEG